MSTRIEGIIDRLTDAEKFDDICWILGDSVAENYAQSVIDSYIKENFEFHSKAGLPASMTRTITERKACKFCKARQGKFTLDDLPAGVWSRHENCKCVITYIPVDGSTVQTLRGTGKKWEIVDEQVLNERKTVNLVTRVSKDVLRTRRIIGTNEEPPKNAKDKLVSSGYATAKDGKVFFNANGRGDFMSTVNSLKMYRNTGFDGAVIDMDGSKWTVADFEKSIRASVKPPFVVEFVRNGETVKKIAV